LIVERGVKPKMPRLFHEERDRRRAEQRGRGRWLATACALIVLLTGLAPWVAAAVPMRQEATDPTTTKDVIVVLDEGADPEAAARELGVTPTFVYDEAFTGFAAKLPPRVREAAARRADVAQITEDFPVRKFAQTLPTGIDRIDADQNATAAINGDGGQIGADIAILDTGIARNRDLNVAGGKTCIGRDWSDDRDGHGTHVAGTAAAKDNNRSVVGVAPGARLWGCESPQQQGNGTWSSVICGLEWVYEHRDRIDVVNMSLGGLAGRDCTSSPLHRAVCLVVNRAGIPIVAAAGNEGRDADRTVPRRSKK
jgi:subtilisin family serine protease